MLRKTSITDKQLKYIINAILLSQIEYLATIHLSKNKKIKKWQAKIRSISRYYLNLPKTLPILVIESSLSFKVGNLRNRLKRKVINEITLGIENKSISGQVFKIRIQQLQNKI